MVIPFNKMRTRQCRWEQTAAVSTTKEWNTASNGESGLLRTRQTSTSQVG